MLLPGPVSGFVWAVKLNFKRLDLQLTHTWTIARGSGTNIFKAIVVELTGADGTVGLGEAAPTGRAAMPAATADCRNSRRLIVPF